MNHFVYTLLHYVYDVLPALAIGFFISGLVHEIIPSKWVERYLGSRGIVPILWATVVGTFLPVCCWGSLPIALSFYKKGSRLGPVLAFLVATPATSITALIVSYRLLGLTFTLYIFFVVIIMGTVVGFFGDMFSYKPKNISGDTCPHCEQEPEHCGCGTGFLARMKKVFRFAFIEMPKDIGLEISIGLLLATFVAVFVPAGRWISVYLAGAFSYFFSVVFGLVMYFCSTASVPLVHAMINQGMNVGAGIVLLIIGPVTSYGTILVLRKEFGVKILLYFLITVSTLAVVFGYIYGKFIM